MYEMTPYNAYAENLLPLHDDIMYPPEKEPAGPGCVLVIAGPPGGGKDTLMNGVLKDANLRFAKGVNIATREPRPGEIPGYDYLFRSEEEFFRMDANSELLEKAKTGDSYKGTPKDFLKGVYRGEKKIWRIDASRTAVLPEWMRSEIPNDAEYILSRLKVITVMPSDLNVLYERAAKREGSEFNFQKFQRRVEEEMFHIRKNPERFGTFLYNDGSPEEMIENGLGMINNWINDLNALDAQQEPNNL